MDREILRNIGLTKIEIDIYLGLFKLGPSTATKIAEFTKIHRTNAYDYLDRLIKKGLVTSTTKDRKRFFSVTDPNNLVSFLDKRKEELDSTKDDLKKVVENLRKIPIAASPHSRIETYHDRAGLESFYEKLLEIAASKDELDIIGSSEVIDSIYNYYLLNLTKKFVKIKVKVRMVANKTIIGSKYMKLILKMLNIKLRYVDVAYLSPTATFIFKDYTGICYFQKNPFVILIEDNEVADYYRKHFSTMWDISKK